VYVLLEAATNFIELAESKKPKRNSTVDMFKIKKKEMSVTSRILQMQCLS